MFIYSKLCHSIPIVHLLMEILQDFKEFIFALLLKQKVRYEFGNDDCIELWISQMFATPTYTQKCLFQI